MTQVIYVRQLHEWAILPSKQHVDRSGPREESQLLAAHLRYHRQFRYPHACPPWVLGQELGWVVSSPVSITFSPLDDVQIAAENKEEVHTAGRLFSREEFWQHSAGYIAVSRNDWLRTFQYRGAGGRWEGMFLPNGHGSAEWRLGWAIRIPEDHFLLVTSLDEPTGMTVPTGVLTARQANRTWDQGGFSLAVRPDTRVSVRRGQPIARIVLLGRDSLQAGMEETGMRDSQ